MKKILLLAFLLPLFSTAKNTPPKTAAQKLELFLSVADSLRLQAEIPGVGLAIVYDHKVLYTGGMGFSNLEKATPVTENTIFQIGSTSKAFTGVLAAKLVERGQLAWKKPIINYLPNFKLSEPYIAQHLNLEDAFTHMTGLARKDELWHDQPLSREEVYQQVETMEFTHSFRGEWDYNNHMYVVAGKVLETIAQQSWEEMIRQEIFAPLEMNDAHASFQEFMDDPQRSTGYQRDGKTVHAHVSTDNIAPAGGVSASPKDIAKWLLMMTNEGIYQGKRLLQEKEYEYLTSPKGMSLEGPCAVRYYSIGWGANQTNGRKYLRHSGGIAGQNAVALVMPEDGFGVFIMTNQVSDYKEILADFAESVFVKEEAQRDYTAEDRLRSFTHYIRFQNTLLDEGMEKAKTLYATIPYKNFEAPMNDLGYYLMQEGRLEESRFVLELNMLDHPQSANVYDSYGEILLQLDQKDKAIEMYEKSVSLNPQNTHAIEVLKLIKNK